jgi:hypothetical protein
MDVILEVLVSDLRWLAASTGIIGAFLFIPAVFAGFIAAVRTAPTRWCDVPGGILRGWLASVLAAIVWMLFFFRLGQFLVEILRPLPEARLDQPLILAFGIGALVCPVIGYFVAVRYFRWKVKDLGWKIANEPPRRQRRYAFTMRTLLIVQLAVVVVFGLWVTGRRELIHAQTSLRQTELWRAELGERLAGYGWDLAYPQRPLRLAHPEPQLRNFNDDVLDRLLPSDQVSHLELRSDELTDEGIKKLAAHPTLCSLELHSLKITDSGVKHLKSLSNLEVVNLSSPQLTDQVLDDLGSTRSLRTIIVYDGKITRAAAARFREDNPEVSLLVVSPK